MELLKTISTNKYAEGYPGERDYKFHNQIECVEKTLPVIVCAVSSVPGAQICSRLQAIWTVGLFIATTQNPATKSSIRTSTTITSPTEIMSTSPINIMKYEIASYNVNQDAEFLDYAKIKAFSHKIKHDPIVSSTSSHPGGISFKIFVEDTNTRFMENVTHIPTSCCTNLPSQSANIATTHKTPSTQRSLSMHVIAKKTTRLCETTSNEYKYHIKPVAKNCKRFAKTPTNNSFRFVADRTNDHLCHLDLSGHGTFYQQAEMTLNKIKISMDKNIISHQHFLYLETWILAFWNYNPRTTAQCEKKGENGGTNIFPAYTTTSTILPFLPRSKQRKRELQPSVYNTNFTLKFGNKIKLAI
jgi:glycine/serine hydroxymethyltransferase